MVMPSPMDLDFESANFVRAQKIESWPERLFHYTTQSGLLGILDSGAVWATKVQYLNDSTEFGLALATAKTRLESRINACKKTGGSDVGVDVLRVIMNNLHGITNSNVCAVSFCQDGDLLSQWRGYGLGYSIGFRTNVLAKKAAIFDCRLYRCIYDESTQIKIVDELIDSAMQVAREMVAHSGQEHRSSSVLGCAARFERSVVKYGACFKHGTFKEENEWRIITAPVSFTDKNLKFREGVSTIVPHYILRLVDRIDVKGTIINGAWFGIIDRLVIGPSPHPQLSEQSMLGLIMKYFISDPRDAVRVDYHERLRSYLVHSAIPFRNW
jgi:hypothetical protein